MGLPPSYGCPSHGGGPLQCDFSIRSDEFAASVCGSERLRGSPPDYITGFPFAL
ncbi:MAG TPA: hypothetical protein GX701_05090 [Clostridiales bacterium]|nr:hypothetical protein [Clostridiales bacterium]